MVDKLEDAIYASPVGSTTPWRCTGCGQAIAHAGQPCKCTHPDDDVRVEVRIYNSKGDELRYSSPLRETDKEQVAGMMKHAILQGRVELARHIAKKAKR